MKKIIIALLLSFFHLLSHAQDISRDTVTKQDTIESQTKLQDIVIKTPPKRQLADRAVYTFSKEDLEKARYAKDLLRTLPELKLDPITNTLKSTKGGTTLFLINGIEATDMQIRSVQPSEVVKVEYYDIPPARFATRADIVVNLITRNPETGYVFGSDLSSALSTGFVNGSAYGNYTHGKNDFGMEYSINFRDYDNRTVRSIYDYDLNNIHYRSDENKKDHFGYTYQNVALRYTRAVPEKYVFQAKLNTDIFTSFVKGNGQSIFYQNNDTALHAMFKNGNSSYTQPTLDLYFSKNLSKKDELIFNFVGTHFTTRNAELAQEWELRSGNSVYDNDMDLKAKQTGIVGEVAHVHSFGKGSLSSGYRISSTSISNDLQNLSGFSQYKVNYLQQYFYTEYSGKKAQLSYRIGAGLTNIHNKSEENVDNQWVFTPKLILSYQIDNQQNLRFTSSYKPQSPGSSQLSSNIVQMAPNIVQKGNPYLKTSDRWSNNLIYTFNNKHFDFNTNLFYWYTAKAFNQYYVLDNTQGGYALTYENAQNDRLYGIQIVGSYRPFGNRLLVLQAVVTPTSESLRTSNGTLIKNNYVGNDFTLSSEYKSFSIQYNVNIPVYTLNGAFLQTNENANHLFASYKKKEWTFTSGMYWIGMPSDYRTKSLPESLVNYSRRNQIWNNKSMFIVGVSFDFSKGKRTNINKKLSNSTAPAATF